MNNYKWLSSWSRSTWACELKSCGRSGLPAVDVTLHVSVWVEIRERAWRLLRHPVTLHVSVWVEIYIFVHSGKFWRVTLHVSVWVEIPQPVKSKSFATCHAPRERVSWNSSCIARRHRSIRHAPRERVSWNSRCLMYAALTSRSRSTWACELKLSSLIVVHVLLSHAPRERVSWNFYIFSSRGVEWSHAPRERVSWNSVHVPTYRHSQVTLHVSVWVEIFETRSERAYNMSRSTWACELKFDSCECHLY